MTDPLPLLTALAGAMRKPAQMILLLLGMTVLLLPDVSRAASRPPGHGSPAPLVRVTSILGVTTNMDLDAARARLRPLGSSPQTGEKDTDRGSGGTAPSGGDPDARPVEVWTLRSTPFARVVFAADARGRLQWVTGFLRPGQEVPFARIGDLSRSTARSEGRALWNVLSTRGSYRVRAGGRGGKATFISLIAIRAVSPNGIFSPQTVPTGGDAGKVKG